MKARLTTLKAIGLLLHNTGEGRELPDLVFKSRHTVEMTHAGQPFPRHKLVCDDPSQQQHVARLRLLPAELMPAHATAQRGPLRGVCSTCTRR